MAGLSSFCAMHEFLSETDKCWQRLTVIIIVFEGGAGCTTGGRFERSNFKFAFVDERLLLLGVSDGDAGGGGSVLDIITESECFLMVWKEEVSGLNVAEMDRAGRHL